MPTRGRSARVPTRDLVLEVRNLLLALLEVIELLLARRRAPARSKIHATSKIHTTSNFRASLGIFPSPSSEAPGIPPHWGAQWGGGLAEAIHLPSFAHSERSDLRF